MEVVAYDGMEVVGRFGQICQKLRFFETPLTRCASTRAFEWYQFRVIWRLWSKVMVRLLKSPHVRYPPLEIGILIGGISDVR